MHFCFKMKDLKKYLSKLFLLLALALVFSSCEKNELLDVTGEDQWYKSSNNNGDGFNNGDITDDEDDDEDDEDKDVNSANI